MKLLDWNMMKVGPGELIGKKYILYGASSSCKKMLYYMRTLHLQDSIIGICDSDKDKWGVMWNGYRIMSPDELIKMSEDVIIIISSVYLEEIYLYLQSIKSPLNVISSMAFKLSVHYGVMNNKVDYFDKDTVKYYKKCYSLWCELNPNIFWNYRNVHRAMRLILNCESCLLIHSMPKTGNTTLGASFSNIPNAIKTLHAIWSNEEEKERLHTIINSVDCDIRIITGVRYPIERIISQQWQRIGFPNMYGDKCLPTVINDETINNLGLTDFELWFENQMKEAFGIDIFTYPFNKEKGYSIIRKNNISVFLYRLDYLNKLENELGEFAGASDFRLISANMAKDKGYKLAYQQYLSEVTVDAMFFEKVMNSKEMRHFFTEDECQLYREKWADFVAL